MNFKNCQNCGVENPPGMKFCDECGTELAVNKPDTKKCTECGNVYPAEFTFCDSCGAGAKEENAEVKCPECGNVYPVRFDFCDSCGADRYQKPQITPTVIKTAPGGARKKIVRFAPAAAAVVVIGIIGIVIATRDDSSGSISTYEPRRTTTAASRTTTAAKKETEAETTKARTFSLPELTEAVTTTFSPSYGDSQGADGLRGSSTASNTTVTSSQGIGLRGYRTTEAKTNATVVESNNTQSNSSQAYTQTDVDKWKKVITTDPAYDIWDIMRDELHDPQLPSEAVNYNFTVGRTKYRDGMFVYDYFLIEQFQKLFNFSEFNDTTLSGFATYWTKVYPNKITDDFYYAGSLVEGTTYDINFSDDYLIGEFENSIMKYGTINNNETGIDVYGSFGHDGTNYYLHGPGCYQNNYKIVKEDLALDYFGISTAHKGIRMYGNFKNGLLDGIGYSFNYNEGDGIKIMGEFKDGYLNGYGYITFNVDVQYGEGTYQILAGKFENGVCVMPFSQEVVEEHLQTTPTNWKGVINLAFGGSSGSSINSAGTRCEVCSGRGYSQRFIADGGADSPFSSYMDQDCGFCIGGYK